MHSCCFDCSSRPDHAKPALIKGLTGDLHRLAQSGSPNQTAVHAGCKTLLIKDLLVELSLLLSAPARLNVVVQTTIVARRGHNALDATGAGMLGSDSIMLQRNAR
jgi:hypothetical protein